MIAQMRACLDSWKWEKNEKWKKSFLTSLVCFEPKMENENFFTFLFYTSLLHYHFHFQGATVNFVVM